MPNRRLLGQRLATGLALTLVGGSAHLLGLPDADFVLTIAVIALLCTVIAYLHELVHPDPHPHRSEHQTAAPAHPGCEFCAIAAGTAPADIVRAWPDALAFVPLRPRTTGHVLVVPRQHVRDFADDPAVTGASAARAAELAAERGSDANLITSKGTAATQTVFHLHWHLVPREDGDDIALPWTGQHTAEQHR